MKLRTLTLLFLLCSQAFADRVVVLGLGAVTAIGNDVRSFWSSLEAGRHGVREVSIAEVPADAPFRWVAEIPVTDAQLASGLNGCPFVLSTITRNVDRQSLFAVMGCSEAAMDGGLLLRDTSAGRSHWRAPMNRIGVILGSTLGGAIVGGVTGSRLLTGALPRASSNVAFALGLEGDSSCVSAACASGLHAVISAAQALGARAADLILAGATDAQISELGLRARQAVLSPDGVSRPFSTEANGTVLGEGAGVLLLGRERYAVRHRYPVRAAIAGYRRMIARGASPDLTRIESSLIASTMRDALESGSIPPDQIAAIFAHAPGTPLGDEAELVAIRSVFGERAARIPIVSLTSRIGHPLGPSGALRLVAAVRALEAQFLPGNLNLGTPRAGFEGYTFVGERGMRLEGARYILVNSFGFGGHYSTIILERI